MNPKNKRQVIVLLVTVFFIAVFTILLKIGKDDIYYLCGNFSAGETKTNVIRQLETANLSRYTSTVAENGSIIVLSSRLFFVTNQCVIEFNKSGKVVNVSYK